MYVYSLELYNISPPVCITIHSLGLRPVSTTLYYQSCLELTSKCLRTILFWLTTVVVPTGTYICSSVCTSVRLVESVPRRYCTIDYPVTRVRYAISNARTKLMPKTQNAKRAELQNCRWERTSQIKNTTVAHFYCIADLDCCCSFALVTLSSLLDE